MEVRIILCREIYMAESVQISYWSFSYDWYASHSSTLLDPFGELRSFRMWDKGMDDHPEDETSYTTQYQEAFPKYMENVNRAEGRHLPVTIPECVLNHNLIYSAMASRSGQSSYDRYDLSSDDEEYLIPKYVAEMTPRGSDHAARLSTAARLYFNSPSDFPQN